MDAPQTKSAIVDGMSHEAREARLRANLAAVRAYQPEWAARIEACADRQGAVPCKARDGTWSWRLTSDMSGSGGATQESEPSGAATSHWLGRTSMPSVSAAALFENVQREGGVVLPGILSGAEVIELSQRIAPTAAVFILESDAGLLRLAMQARDFSAMIDERRLVLVAADESGDDLARFFERHEGFEFPSRLLRTPQTEAAVFQRAQACVEHAAARVRDRRERRARELVGIWGDGVSSAALDVTAAPVSAMIVTASRSPAARAWTSAMASAANPTGRAIAHLPDRPDRADWGAALATAADAAVNLLVAIDPRAAEFARLAPKQVQTVCWLTPEADVRSCTPALGECGLLLASTTRQLAMLKDAGFAAELLEPPVSPVEARGTDAAPSSDAPVLIDDGPRDDSDALGVGLPSHRALLDAARAICLEKARTSGSLDADEALATAEQRTGMTVEEADVRAWLAELVQLRIMPAARRRAVVEAMQSARLIRSAGGVTAPSASASAADWRSVRPRIWVRPHAIPADAGDMISALCAGVHVVAWRYAPDVAAAHPMLHPGLAGVAWFDRPTEAVRLAQKALASREPPAGPPAEWVSAQGMAGRWSSLLAMLRSAASNATLRSSPG